MTQQQLAIAVAGLILAGSIGCCGPNACGPYALIGGSCGPTCGESVSDCGCGGETPDCGSDVSAEDCDFPADDCGCSDDMACKTCRPSLRDCLPSWRSLFGCSGCSSNIYWSEWFSDPPDDCDPCDRCGNWTGTRTGSCSGVPGSAVPGGVVSGCSAYGSDTVPTPFLEPTPMQSSAVPIRGDRAATRPR